MNESTPGFSVGEMAWLSDGQSGFIVGGNFNADAGGWVWALDIPGGPFLESDLFHNDPTAVTEAASERQDDDPGVFVTQDELVAAVLNLRRFVEETAGRDFSDEISAAREAGAIALGGAVAGLSSQIENLESAVTLTLSQIAERLDDLEDIAQEESGLSLADIFRGVGRFLRSPFAFILEAGADTILEELNDGLNR